MLGTVLVVVTLLSSGCGRENEDESRGVEVVKFSQLGVPPARESTGVPQDATQRRMIAKSATIDAEVEHCDSALSRVQRVIASAGGYVTKSSLEVGDTGRKVAFLSARIPVGSFDNTMVLVPRLLSKVKSVRVEGTDITDQFYDTVGRLANQRALQASYRGILDRATKIPDLLEVQRALSEVDNEIDRLEGKRQYLSGIADFASISLNLREPSPGAVPTSISLSSKLRQASAAGVDRLGDVLAWTLTVVIAGVPTAVALVVICLVVIHSVRFARRRRKVRQ